jgi:hypothetical protein
MAVIDFTKLDLIFDKIARLDEDKLWVFSVDKPIRDKMIELNTDLQLYEFGIDSNGNPITSDLSGNSFYSDFTVQIKRTKNQRFDHITLKDTGRFYDSFTVDVTVNDIIFDAEDSQFYDVPLFEVYGIDVLGLTDENMVYIKDTILHNYLKILTNELFS